MALAKADVQFQALPGRNHPTLRYATIPAFFHSSRLHTFWVEFPDDDFAESLKLQKRLQTVLGDLLFQRIGLLFHSHLTIEGFVAVSEICHEICFRDWYAKMCDAFNASRLPPESWFNYIWPSLKILIRVVARFLGKSAPQNFFHGNILNGLVFVYDIHGKLVNIKLYHLKSQGSVLYDVQLFWRMIVVVFKNLDKKILSSPENLLKSLDDSTTCPGVLCSYVERLKEVCENLKNVGVAFSDFVLSFVFEDIVFWEELESFYFLSNFTYEVFYNLDKNRRINCLHYMGPIERKFIPDFTFSSTIVTKMFKEFVTTYSSNHGWFIKLTRDQIHHFPIEYHKEQKRRIDAGLAPEEEPVAYNFAHMSDIHRMIEEQVINSPTARVLYPNGIVHYAYVGFQTFMGAPGTSMGDKVTLLQSLEFRDGFRGCKWQT